MERIAVIGLGKVGGLAAELLLDAGFQVQGYDAAPARGTRAAPRSGT